MMSGVGDGGGDDGGNGVSVIATTTIHCSRSIYLWIISECFLAGLPFGPAMHLSIQIIIMSLSHSNDAEYCGSHRNYSLF